MFLMSGEEEEEARKPAALAPRYATRDREIKG